MSSLIGESVKAQATTPSRHLIYGLIDREASELFYIGKTHKRRELRLLEHLECAVSGVERPVYDYIRRLIFRGSIPGIFVIARLSGDQNPLSHEKDWIHYFRNLPSEKLPFLHPAQTPKSEATHIKTVSLRNTIHYDFQPI
jgi:hypothetical protein